MKKLSVGIGCRLHSSSGDIEAAVRAALGPYGFDRVGAVASVDTKGSEAGLLDFCASHALPLLLFSREQIAAIHVADPSAAARQHLGVDGVCEPCALLAASGQSAAVLAGVRAEAVGNAAPGSPDRHAIPLSLKDSERPATVGAPAACDGSSTADARSDRAVPAASNATDSQSACSARLLVAKTRHAGVSVAVAEFRTSATTAKATAGDEPPSTVPYQQDLR